MPDQPIGDPTGRPTDPTDEELLRRVAVVWDRVDPPPPGLADGVLARLAAEATDLDAEFELLTLVEQDLAAAVRSAATAQGADPDAEEVGTWTLEYVGPELRVHLRVTRGEEGTRLDGYVVPARDLEVTLTRDGDGPATGGDGWVRSTDQFGRFELDDVPSGAHRLTLVDRARPTARPRITPPFWI